MATSRRAQRVASQIARDVGNILQTRVDDPDLGFVTVTRADVTADLRQARVFWAVLGNDEDQLRTGKALSRAAKHVRRELGLILGLRHTPEVDFVMDAGYQAERAVLETLRSLDVERTDPSKDMDG